MTLEERARDFADTILGECVSLQYYGYDGANIERDIDSATEVLTDAFKSTDREAYERGRREERERWERRWTEARNALLTILHSAQYGQASGAISDCIDALDRIRKEET